MLLLIHIIITLLSVGFSTFTYFFPSVRKLNINYVLLVGVIGSGTWLTIENPSHLPKSCLSGLLYLGIVLVALIAAKRKLALETTQA